MISRVEISESKERRDATMVAVAFALSFRVLDAEVNIVLVPMIGQGYH